MFAEIYQNRDLLLQLLKRQIQSRYRGSHMGFIWAFIHPILMLLVYMFVFGLVMRVRWGIEGQGNIDFGLILFAGLLMHSLLGEVFNSSVSLITSNSQYVKKVVFPLPILTLVTVANALFHAFIGLGILLLIMLLTGGQFHWTVFLAPLVILPFVIFLTGMSWFLCALGVYFRDLNQFMGVLVTVLLFLGPIVYPFESVPDVIKPYVLWLNPLSVIVQQLRAVLLFGQMPDWQMLGIYSALAVAIFVFGQWFFNKTREGFADVI